MGTERSIRQLIKADKVNMGGILLDQPLPNRGLDQIDPFLLIHHWAQDYPGGQRQKDLGVGPHPHRGFAPVTFIFKGGVHHRDSRGHESVVQAGGTQWMNSGMGLVHSERPAKELAEKGGDFEIIQFWVNSPAKHKMGQPSYQPLHPEKTPIVKTEDGKGSIGVVAGELHGKRSPIDTHSPLLILRLELEKGAVTSLPIPKSYNALSYQLDGALRINGQQDAGQKAMAWYQNDGDEIRLEALSDTRVILLAGEPLNEKISTYGPFVMNSQTEIMEAIRDYQQGKMGVLIEEFD